MLLCCILLAAAPRPGQAGSYLMTAFVPEVGTLTVEGRASTHEEDLHRLDLDRNVFGARLSYVFYPALEGIGELRILSYEIEGRRQNGLGLTGGFKYQFAPLMPEVDTAMAILGSVGSADEIDEAELTVLGMLSKDIAEGWTPFGGIGFSWNRQNFDGDEGLGKADETEIDPVFFGGIKYLYQNAVGAAADVFIQDGVGLELSVSYRF